METNGIYVVLLLHFWNVHDLEPVNALLLYVVNANGVCVKEGPARQLSR